MYFQNINNREETAQHTHSLFSNLLITKCFCCFLPLSLSLSPSLSHTFSLSSLSFNVPFRNIPFLSFISKISLTLSPNHTHTHYTLSLSFQLFIIQAPLLSSLTIISLYLSLLPRLEFRVIIILQFGQHQRAEPFSFLSF